MSEVESWFEVFHWWCDCFFFNHFLFSVCVQLTIVQCLCPADNLQKNMETFVVKMCNAVHNRHILLHRCDLMKETKIHYFLLEPG